MTGKVILKEGKPVLIGKYSEIPINPETPIRFQNQINNRLINETHCWVEYTVTTITIGSNEFDFMESDTALIEKVYDNTFGTDKESISVATERHNKNKYPIQLFAPGYYYGKCYTCSTFFIGDKRARQCEICALEQEIER